MVVGQNTHRNNLTVKILSCAWWAWKLWRSCDFIQAGTFNKTCICSLFLECPTLFYSLWVLPVRPFLHSHALPCYDNSIVQGSWRFSREHWPAKFLWPLEWQVTISCLTGIDVCMHADAWNFHALWESAGSWLSPNGFKWSQKILCTIKRAPSRKPLRHGLWKQGPVYLGSKDLESSGSSWRLLSDPGTEQRSDIPDRRIRFPTTDPIPWVGSF